MVTKDGKRIINIFIGSSITEFALERLQLTNFIWKLGDEFDERYQIKLRPLICENVDTNVSQKRKQDEFNSLILESEMCFFIFFTKAGEYTVEEFRVAYDCLKRFQKPKVYVYFKNVSPALCPGASLQEFKTHLDKDLRHYYGTFDDIDTVKFRILLNLRLQEMDFLSLDYRDGNCYVNGAKVKDFNLSEVSEFSNSRFLESLYEKLKGIDEAYYRYRARYDAESGDAAFFKEYAQIAAERQSVLKEIEQVKKDIFKLSVQMCESAKHGEITAQQRLAYELFEKGDLEGANKILNEDDLDAELESWEQEKNAALRVILGKYITKIEILSAMSKYEGRFEDIDRLYGKIVPKIKENRIELPVLCAYASFLVSQNRLEEAIAACKELEAIYDASPDLATIEDCQALYLLTAKIYGAFSSKNAVAESYYRKAIDALANEDRYGRRALLVARAYDGMATHYITSRRFDKVEEFQSVSLAIYRELAKDGEEESRNHLAECYVNVGSYYAEIGNKSKAIEFYLSAQDLYEKADDEKEEIQAQKASLYSRIGWCYVSLVEKFDEGERYMKQAEAIYEKLKLENPKAYEAALGSMYLDVGIVYFNRLSLNECKPYFLKALEVFQRLSLVSPDAYNKNLALVYNDLALADLSLGQFESSETYWGKAVEIYESLVEIDFEAYAHMLIIIYSNLIKLSLDRSGADVLAQCYCEGSEEEVAEAKQQAQAVKEDAKKLGVKALALAQKLTEKHPDAYDNIAVLICVNLGLLYGGDDDEKAERFLLQAEEIALKGEKADGEVNLTILFQIYGALCVQYSQSGRETETAVYTDKLKATCARILEARGEEIDPFVAGVYDRLSMLFLESEEGVTYMDKCLSIYRALAEQDEKGYLVTYATELLGSVVLYTTLGETEKAKESFFLAADAYQKLVQKGMEQYLPRLADAYVAGANLLSATSTYEEGDADTQLLLECLTKTVEYGEQLGDRYPQLCEALGEYMKTIYLIYDNFGDTENAILYAKKVVGFHSAHEVDDVANAIDACVYLGDYYYGENQYEIAEEYLKTAEKYLQTLDSTDEAYAETAADCYGMLAELYGKTGREELAQAYSQRLDEGKDKFSDSERDIDAMLAFLNKFQS